MQQCCYVSSKPQPAASKPWQTSGWLLLNQHHARVSLYKVPTGWLSAAQQSLLPNPHSVGGSLNTHPSTNALPAITLLLPPCAEPPLPPLQGPHPAWVVFVHVWMCVEHNCRQKARWVFVSVRGQASPPHNVGRVRARRGLNCWGDGAVVLVTCCNCISQCYLYACNTASYGTHFELSRPSTTVTSRSSSCLPACSRVALSSSSLSLSSLASPIAAYSDCTE